jgi:hypothetical protein
MAGDTANPRIWIGADVYVAPLGTTAPTDVTTALPAAFVALGLLSVDSPTLTSDNDETDYFAHGGVYIRTIRSKFKNHVKVVPLEDNKTVWALRNPGSTVSTTTGLTTRVYKTPVPAPQMMVWHLTDGTVTARRIFTKVDLASVGDMAFTDNDILAPEMTFNVYTDSTGVWGREITNDPAAVVP